MKTNNVFWIGYSDLLTSLFFIMLVLFVTTIGYLKYEKTVKEKEYDKILELQTAVQQLPAEYFEYQPQYKRFKLKQQIQFYRGDSIINEKYFAYLGKVGKSIVNLIDSLNKNLEYSKLDIKYLIVIEGMSSRDNYPLNFELSFKRSLSLYKFWKKQGISFNPNVCEIQIAGSGTAGIREYSGNQEFKNQQFLIHIIPKMGKIIESK